MPTPPTTLTTSNRIVIQQGDRQIYLPSWTTYNDAILETHHFLGIPTHIAVSLLLRGPHNERAMLDEANWQALVTSRRQDLAVIYAEMLSPPIIASDLDSNLYETQEQGIPLSDNPTDSNSPLTAPELNLSSNETFADPSPPRVGLDSSFSFQPLPHLASSETPTSPLPYGANFEVITTSILPQDRSPTSHLPALPFGGSSSRVRQNQSDSPSHARPLQAIQSSPTGSSDRPSSSNWTEGLEISVPSSSRLQACDISHIPSPSASPPPLTNSGCSSGVSTPSSIGSPRQHFTHLSPNNIIVPGTSDAAIHDHSAESFGLSRNETTSSECLQRGGYLTGVVGFSPQTIEETRSEGRAGNPSNANLNGSASLVDPTRLQGDGSVHDSQHSAPYWHFREASSALDQTTLAYQHRDIDLLENGDPGSSSAAWPLMVDLRPSSVEGLLSTPPFDQGSSERHGLDLPTDSGELIIASNFDESGRDLNHADIPIAPPPYTSRHDPQHNRRITFCVSLPTGETIYIAARKQTRLLRVLESACAVFHLQPLRCRIIYEGRTFGHGDIARLTVGALDIRHGDQIGLAWDDIIAHSNIYLQSTGPSTQEPIASSEALSLLDTAQARAIVTLTPRWIFEGLSPLVPIDLLPGSQGQEPRSKAVWDLRAGIDGMLVLSGEARPVGSIRWEAQIKPVFPALPIDAPVPSSTMVPPQIIRNTSTSHFDPEPGGVLLHPQRPLPNPIGKSANFQMPYRDALMHLVTLILGVISFLLKPPRLEIAFSQISNSVRTLGITGMAESGDGGSSNGSHLASDDGIFHPMGGSDVFRDENCVVLESSNVSVYLLDIMKELGVPDGISRGWISQRLSLMVRHKWLAIRFLSKLSLAECSTLRIAPEPDEVVRVFMVYMGIPTNELPLWNEAKARGTRDIDNRKNGGIGCGQEWKKIIAGSDGNIHAGQFGFRVFDLGWLEMLP